jgi:hypothetical protein
MALVDRDDDIMAAQRAADPRAFFATVTGALDNQRVEITLTMLPDMDEHQQYIRTEDVSSGLVGSAR